MNRYDIVFMGHLATATIVPFEGASFVERGGPAFFGPMAASCITKNIAAVTRIDENEKDLLEPLEAAGIDLFVQSPGNARYHVIHPNENIDERQIFLIERGGYFSIEDLPPLEPCLIHLGGLSDHEFSLEFMQELKTRGFRLSLDIQSFLWNVNEETQLIHLGDIPDKQEILRMADFVKLDVMEARALTGSDVLQEQAVILEDLGCLETVITRSDGVLARSRGQSTFTRFTYRSVQGRTGRGDTFAGAYLARRLNYSIEDSLRFAAALTSIKVETLGPFMGCLEEVVKRMDDSFSC